MPRHPAFARDPRTGVRTFLTEDLALTAAGPIRIVGRADDVIVTGGIKIDPAVVESVLSRVTGVADVVVTGVPDREWGAVVVAVVQARPGQPPDLSALRRAATYAHGPAAAPRHLLLVTHIPQRASGKADRAAVRELAVRELSGSDRSRTAPSRTDPSSTDPSGDHHSTNDSRG
jgi:o-succinylbenzoate---CoA ligase